MESATQSMTKRDHLSYLANLITVVNYLDDTGQEHHQKRLLLASEWDKAFSKFCEAIADEDNA